MTKLNWVDLTKLKTMFTIKQVIEHYNIKLKQSGQSHVGCCPIHHGKNRKSFSVDLEGNKWNCFGDCKTGGNHLDLVQMIEFGEKTGANARQAGLKVQEWLGLSTKDTSDNSRSKPEKKVKKKTGVNTDPIATPEKKKNEPLKFKFNHLIKEHPWFNERGIKRKTIEHFELGLQEKGKTIPGRIAIPIHDEQGSLIAYCGRAVDETQVEEHGKYKQPPNFLKSRVVYNLNRVPPGEKILIVVESFISIWWLWQAGIKNVICLMGSKLCLEQKELILNYFKDIKGGLFLMLDNDKDGEKCTKEIFFELGSVLYMKRVEYSDFGKKPHHLEIEKLKQLLKL